MSESGNQVIDRSVRIMWAVADAGPDGARLLDLAEATAIARPTVHRLLQALMDVGFITQTDRRRYALGAALHDLGMRAPNESGDVLRFRPMVQDVATKGGDVVYLGVRRGDRITYPIRVEGDYPIRTFTMPVDTPVPLTDSYGGLALLAAAPERESEAVIHRLVADADIAAQRKAVVGALRQQLATQRFAGGTELVSHRVPGLAGLSVPVANPRGAHPYLVVSYSAIVQRMPADRIGFLSRLLLDLADAIAAQLAVGR